MRTAIVVLAFTAAPTPAQTTLRYKFKEGDKLHYVLDQDMTTTIGIKGKETDTRLHVIWDLEWAVLKVDGGGSGTVEIKIARARMLLDGPAGKAAADSDDKNEPDNALRKTMAASVKVMAAMELRGTILPTGEMKNVRATEETLKAMKDLGGAKTQDDLLNSDMARSMQFATAFPSDAIAKGKTWAKKIETKAGFGKTITENTSTYEGPIEKDGLMLEKVSLKLAMKIEPDAKPAIKAEIKDLKSNGYLLFDNKAGRLIDTVTNQRTEMVLEVMGMSFNQTIEQSVTIRLKTK